MMTTIDWIAFILIAALGVAYFAYYFASRFSIKSFKLFGLIRIYWAYNNKMGCLRIGKFGICWRDVNVHRLTFSERNGYIKFLLIGEWCFKILPKPTNNTK